MMETRLRIAELEQNIRKEKLAIQVRYYVLKERTKRKMLSPTAAIGAAVLGFLFAPRSKKSAKAIQKSAATPLLAMIALWFRRATHWYGLAQKMTFLAPLLGGLGKGALLTKFLGKIGK